jgi:hypothetical protein
LLGLEVRGNTTLLDRVRSGTNPVDRVTIQTRVMIARS